MQDAYESEERIAAAESTWTLSRRYALMETRATLRPGDRGTRRLTERFGKRLVCVRYRYDAASGRRFTTVELVVAEAAWKPRARKARANRSPDEMVYVRVGFGEEALRAIVGVAVGGGAGAGARFMNPHLHTYRHKQASSIGSMLAPVYAFSSDSLSPNH